MESKKRRQINNLRLRWSKTYKKWGVWTPCGFLLKVCYKKIEAIRYTKNNKDYIGERK